MHKLAIGLLLMVGSVAAQNTMNRQIDTASLKQQVIATETAFARTMATRDYEKFCTFIADEAVFFSGHGILRGKKAVISDWKVHFSEPNAPFSWAPETVEVLDSGNLALSTGPVFDKSGKQVATFTSTWRLEKDGAWKIVFDSGNPVCK